MSSVDRTSDSSSHQAIDEARLWHADSNTEKNSEEGGRSSTKTGPFMRNGARFAVGYGTFVSRPLGTNAKHFLNKLLRRPLNFSRQIGRKGLGASHIHGFHHRIEESDHGDGHSREGKQHEHQQGHHGEDKRRRPPIKIQLGKSIAPAAFRHSLSEAAQSSEGSADAEETMRSAWTRNFSAIGDTLASDPQASLTAPVLGSFLDLLHARLGNPLMQNGIKQMGLPGVKQQLLAAEDESGPKKSGAPVSNPRMKTHNLLGPLFLLQFERPYTAKQIPLAANRLQCGLLATGERGTGHDHGGEKHPPLPEKSSGSDVAGTTKKPLAPFSVSSMWGHTGKQDTKIET